MPPRSTRRPATTYVGERDRDAQSPRAKLFSDLVRTFFTSWTAQQGRFVDLDTGLGVVSRHADTLGYDAVVLYLDELILWLAGNSSDLPFVGREYQKLVKLKEAQDADRTIPIVSFIARQRDLQDFLGEHAQGSVRAELSRAASHHQGRFEVVELADSNLPGDRGPPGRAAEGRGGGGAARRRLRQDLARGRSGARACSSAARGTRPTSNDPSAVRTRRASISRGSR